MAIRDCTLKRLRQTRRQWLLRSQTESHRAARSPDGFQHSDVVLVHGHVDARGEGAGELRPSTLHLHRVR